MKAPEATAPSASPRLHVRVRRGKRSTMLDHVDTSPAPPKDRAAPRISFVSLGCPKALVDSERIITRLRAEGYEITQVARRRRCGGRQHLRLPRQRQAGIARRDRRAPWRENGKVIVTGCMGAEPERDPRRLSRTSSPSPDRRPTRASWRPCTRRRRRCTTRSSTWCRPQGIKLTPRHYAYLKISEGCNNRCSFCIIPKLRGDLVSRPVGEVLREAEKLVKAGVKELLVVSQDTGAYGLDLRYAGRAPGGTARCGPSSSTSRASSASSAPGCGCTTSTPTRMSTR